MTDPSRADLNAYRASRALFVQEQSWKTEAGCLSGFYQYAAESGWIESDPVPRWGKRNTFSGRGVTNRTIKFLTEGQLRLFQIPKRIAEARRNSKFMNYGNNYERRTRRSLSLSAI